jgi:uncharacterized protein YjbI with pentapeptide repeats
MNKKIFSKVEMIEKLKQHSEWLKSCDKHIDNADISGEQFKLIDLSICDMSFENENFSNTDIFGCEFLNIKFKKCSFTRSVVWGSKFYQCSFEGCSMYKADLRGSAFDNAVFYQCDFTRADLTDVEMLGADLSSCNFSWAWLLGADLRYANLEGVNFDNAKFNGAKLYNDRKFIIDSMKDVNVGKIDMSPNADGTNILGKEGFDLLVRNSSE